MISSEKNIVFLKKWYQDHLIWFGSTDSTTISSNTVIYKKKINLHENGEYGSP